MENARTKTDVLLVKSWFEKKKDDVGKDYTDLGLANILQIGGDYPVALDLLFSILPHFESRKDSFGIWNNGAFSPYLDAYLENDFAEVYLNTHILDSASYYAHEALTASASFEVKDQRMRSYQYLYKSFELANRSDSMNKYFRLAMLTRNRCWTSKS